VAVAEKNNDLHQPIVKRAYSVQEIAEILSISRSKAYELCNSDEFKTIRIGRSLRISKASFDKWLDSNDI
jgi:excisionase family DNA binding protein